VKPVLPSPPRRPKNSRPKDTYLRIQSGAGVGASATDEAYVAAGAEITDAGAPLAAELVLKVRNPFDNEVALMKPGTTLVGMLNPFDAAGLQRLAAPT
jgi:NAD(P) transhydrogenase subunit alpha